MVSVEHADARERHPAEDGQRDQVEQRLRDHRAQHHRQRLPRAPEPARDDQGARGLAQAGGQRRGHEHADERALHRVSSFGPPPGRRRGEDRVPGDRAREHGRAHQSQARGEQTGLGCRERGHHVRHAHALQRHGGERRGRQRAGREPEPAQDAHAARAAVRRRRVRAQAGQALGRHARQQVGGRQPVAHGDARQAASRRACGAARERLLVAVEDFARHVRPREALGALARCASHARAARRLEREPAQRLGERERVAGGQQLTLHPVAQHLAVARDVRGEHRLAGRKRLRQHHPEALAMQRGRAQHVRAGELRQLALL